MIRYEPENKAAFLRKEWPFLHRPKMNDMVRCIHCWDEYKMKEYVTIIHPQHGYMICCKNYPKCDGTAIDIHEIEKKP